MFPRISNMEFMQDLLKKEKKEENKVEEQLIRIYNTLKLIYVKGDDVVPMAQCLISLQQLIDEQNIENKEEE